jgi:glucan biosynthesis protein
MSSKTKTFDCVDMKRQAQQRLQAEYESRKAEFPSYFAFLETKACETPWQREFWAKMAESRAEAGK